MKKQPRKHGTEDGTCRPHEGSVCRVAIEPRPNDGEQTRLQKIQNYINGFAASVGLVGLLFVYISLGATRDAANAANAQSITAQDTLKISQRPWVGLEGKPQFIFTGDGQPIRWKYAWQNDGNSPALHLSWHARMFTGPSDRIDWNGIKRAIDNLDTGPAGYITLLNGQSAEDVGISVVYLHSGDSKSIENGSLSVILGGKVTYTDEFGNDHTTTFCRRYQRIIGLTDVYFACEITEKAD